MGAFNYMEENLEKEFHVSWYIIVYKLTFGLIEFLLGLGLVLAKSVVLPWYRNLASQELLEDPHDVLIRFTQQVVPFILTHRGFLVFYLLLLGLAKIAGAIGLMYKKNWGVDLLVGLTVVLMPFQVYQLIRRFSLAEFTYLVVGLLIVLYLVNFKPKKYAKSLMDKIRAYKL